MKGEIFSIFSGANPEIYTRSILLNTLGSLNDHATIMYMHLYVYRNRKRTMHIPTSKGHPRICCRKSATNNRNGLRHRGRGSTRDINYVFQ